MPLITLDKISLAFGQQFLLDDVKFNLEPGERVCLIGRNGAGKSSLLKIVEGLQQADSGNVWRQPGIKIARLEQDLPQTSEQTVFEVVAAGLEELGKLLVQYHALAQRLADVADENELKKLAELQRQIDVQDGWRFNQQIETILTKLNLPADIKLKELSGGWQRRVALAKALVCQPDLLLLDEPTNHLDIHAIQWLEDQLLTFRGGLLFITHDRAFLQRVATRIIELDRGNLTSWPGDYQHFLNKKAELLAAEARHAEEFDKKLAAEEKWIRQGIKARRTRNEGRVRALYALRNERVQRREVQGKASFALEEAERSGQLVITAEAVSHRYAEKELIKNFSIRIMRGDRIALIGPNGCGKSTLLKILLDELKPDQGTVQHGTKLQILYFDQLRRQLDPEKTVIDNIAEGRESITLNGRSRHIMSYLSDFLFTPERARTPVKALSGGECNRLLLAWLFSHPANVLVLDEPTNDLDIETLELLEEILLEFTGTLLLVSHDRAFVDNVVTSTLVFEGNGKIHEYVGGYQDWLRQSQANMKTPVKPPVNVQKAAVKAPATEFVKPKKLSYKEQRELEILPAKIEALEQEQTELTAFTSSAEFYQRNADEMAKSWNRLKEIEAELVVAYQRWEELEKSRASD